MDYRNIPRENKAELLERAVLNETPEQLAETYRELGYIEMTARALGLACRFCGVEKVRALAECGAAFDVPEGEAAERRYHCYSGMKYANYRSNFSLYLLKIFKHIKGACCCKGLKLVKQAATADKKYLPFLPDGERLEVLRYLCENAEKLSFDPSEMLYYAVFARDAVIVDELKRLGVSLSDTRLKRLTGGGQISDSYWYEWCAMTGKLSDGDYLPVMKRLSGELGGAKFHCTGKIYDAVKKRFADPGVVEFFNDNFKTDRLNKTDIVRSLIDCDSVGALPCIERLGWLGDTKRRDLMIEYAQKTGKTECTAWLLDFKNRTADLAAERAKAEKKMLAELNADPNSVMMLKKQWSFKKRGDGTLVITNYKGSATSVTIPGKIGKSIVAEIGDGAFAASSRLFAGVMVSRAAWEQQCARRMITRISLPDSLTRIGVGAFADLAGITELVIPEGVAAIGTGAFYNCASLSKAVIPSSVKRIDSSAFDCCKNLTAVVVKGSYAERYCKENDIKTIYAKAESV
ncbi:MAG: leucine-rich repeat domain-containing protein [Ruminococcus sp.]|nr:leucine-rich repeat domain-containing protein [Ruminococcus sp.]